MLIRHPDALIVLLPVDKKWFNLLTQFTLLWRNCTFTSLVVHDGVGPPPKDSKSPILPLYEWTIKHHGSSLLTFIVLPNWFTLYDLWYRWPYIDWPSSKKTRGGFGDKVLREGVEPSTYALEERCSNPLSYRSILQDRFFCVLFPKWICISICCCIYL